MEQFMALSGRDQSHKDVDLQAFTKALVAALVARDRKGVRPQSPQDRKGFSSIVTSLDEGVRRLAGQDIDRRFVRQMIRVVNALRPSNSGGFEGFETALRSLQLTDTSCPNPFYEEIVFPVPKALARATVEALPDIYRGLVNQAADAFVFSVTAQSSVD